MHHSHRLLSWGCVYKMSKFVVNLGVLLGIKVLQNTFLLCLAMAFLPFSSWIMLSLRDEKLFCAFEVKMA